MRNLALLCVLMPTVSVAQHLEIVTPIGDAITPNHANDSSAVAQAAFDVDEPYVVRAGQIRFSSDVFFSPPSAAANRQVAQTLQHVQTLGVALFDDAGFTVSIDNQSRIGADALLLQGSLDGQPTSSFTLTVTQAHYLMTLQDLNDAWLYRVVGDTTTGIGQVMEIDRTKIPPILDSPPIVPPGR